MRRRNELALLPKLPLLITARLIARVTSERAWWKQSGLDPIKIARKLWKHTRANEGRIPPDRMTLGSRPIG